jgi:hypothetical protein
MIPDPAFLLNKLDVRLPLTGFYDAPEAAAFKPLIRPKGMVRHRCVFMYFNSWIKGFTLDLTVKRSVCRGCARTFFGQDTRDRHEFLNFLACEEGLKSSAEAMGKWLDRDQPYQPRNTHLLIGPYRGECFEFLKSVTFWVNPDQISALVIGAHYHHQPDDAAAPVIAPFGSGCMQLVSVFHDLNEPQAVIGSTDLAMRPYIPPRIMAFTVTVPMFRRLCELDEQSFLGKAFLDKLRQSRS